MTRESSMTKGNSGEFTSVVSSPWSVVIGPLCLLTTDHGPLTTDHYWISLPAEYLFVLGDGEVQGLRSLQHPVGGLARHQGAAHALGAGTAAAAEDLHHARRQ